MISLEQYRTVIGNFDSKLRGVSIKMRDKDKIKKGGKYRSKRNMKGIIWILYLMVITVTMFGEIV